MPNKKLSLRKRIKRPRLLPKAPTGIQGLDEITVGGLPKGRTTLVCGSAGCGKTMFAMEFLVRGAQQYGEPGVFVSFEESAEDLAQNVASTGFDLKALAARKKLLIDHVRVVRSEIEETGNFDLEGPGQSGGRRAAATPGWLGRKACRAGCRARPAAISSVVNLRA
jgi:replicative DNA helicase